MGRKVELPKQPPEVFCKGCWIYEYRRDVSVLLNEVFEGECSWDFKTCFDSCVRNTKEKVDSDYYQRNKERIKSRMRQYQREKKARANEQEKAVSVL